MCFSVFERMIAWRYLRSKRSERFLSLTSWFAVVGITLGVAALIVITSVMNGVKSEMVRHFIGFGGHIEVRSAMGSVDQYAQIADTLRHIPGVTEVRAVVMGQAMAAAHGRASGVEVLGMQPADLANLSDLKGKISPDCVQRFVPGSGAILGQRLADDLLLASDASVTLLSPDGRPTLLGMMPRVQSYPVLCSFSLGMSLYDAGVMLLPFADAQLFFKLRDGGQDRASALQLRVEHPDQAPQVAEAIRQRLGEGYHVLTWEESNRSVFEALAVQRSAMFLILMLIILVAAFNMISMLVMLVKEKRRDIAILRTMGATRREVASIFFLSGAMLGTLGTSVGLGIGLYVAAHADAIRRAVEQATHGKVLAEQLYFLSSLPAEVNPVEVALIIALSLGLSFSATIYPALQASREEPAQALRLH